MSDTFRSNQLAPSCASASTSLLVSVQNLDEAQRVWKTGVDILDFKDPKAGSLGRANPQLLKDFLGWKASSPRQTNISASTANPRLSFAAGELKNQSACAMDEFGQDILEQFQFAKIGLAGCLNSEWRRNWSDFWEGSFQCAPVMACYLDHYKCEAPEPVDCLELAANHPRCTTVLLDTFDKAQDLFASTTVEALSEFICAAASQQINVVIAGSVGFDTLDSILDLTPFAIGVRGAVCDGTRTSEINLAKVEALLERTRHSHAEARLQTLATGQCHPAASDTPLDFSQGE